MRTHLYRIPLGVFQSILLLLLVQQCAWICGDELASELIKPRPIDGYAALSTRVHYPKTIREAGIEGKVIVSALVSVEGQVRQTRITVSLNPELDQIVTNAIKRTRFEPATRKGKPEEVWISIPFVFAFNEWKSSKTPFTDFSMTIHPDPAYKNFEVEIMGQLKEGLEWPLRIECMLPFNATKPWVNRGDGKSPVTGIVRDDDGEWLIFQVSSRDLVFGFTYRTMEEILDHKFLYEFALNHPIPDWELKVVYGSQSVHFTQTPDRQIILESGETQFEYDFKAQDTYESRYLEIALQK